jgi:hypothetical protein
LFSHSNERLDFGSGIKEAVVSKKNLLMYGTLNKDWTKFTTK